MMSYCDSVAPALTVSLSTLPSYGESVMARYHSPLALESTLIILVVHQSLSLPLSLSPFSMNMISCRSGSTAIFKSPPQRQKQLDSSAPPFLRTESETTAVLAQVAVT